jgi:hypothetical protein
VHVPSIKDEGREIGFGLRLGLGYTTVCNEIGAAFRQPPSARFIKLNAQSTERNKERSAKHRVKSIG